MTLQETHYTRKLPVEQIVLSVNIMRPGIETVTIMEYLENKNMMCTDLGVYILILVHEIFFFVTARSVYINKLS